MTEPEARGGMTPQTSDVEAEWARANKGAWKRRLPFVVGLVVGLLGAGLGLGIAAALGGGAQAHQKELDDQGLREVCIKAGCHEREAMGSGIILIALPAVLALGGFAGGFLVSGGKLSGAYAAGLRRL